AVAKGFDAHFIVGKEAETVTTAKMMQRTVPQFELFGPRAEGSDGRGKLEVGHGSTPFGVVQTPWPMGLVASNALVSVQMLVPFENVPMGDLLEHRRHNMWIPKTCPTQSAGSCPW